MPAARLFRYLLFGGLVALSASWVLPAPAEQRPLGFDRASQTETWRETQKIPKNPLNHSWIESYTALGDSYSAGLGAGYILAEDDAAKTGSDCPHFSHSYPSLLNKDNLIGANPKRVFQHLACSGAKVDEMRANQVPHMQPSQLVTLSAGGNDANLASILNACVYQWFPWFQPDCKQQLKATHATINSKAYAHDLKSLVAEITQKLDGPRARIYWVGYPRFWDTRTTECDNVTWAFSWNLLHRQYLTQGLRTDMNDLIDNVNVKIKAACDAAERCIFVDTQADIERTEGHFCQPGVDESYSIITGGAAANRVPTWFYEWGTTKDDGVFTLPDEETSGPDGKAMTTSHSGRGSDKNIETALAALSGTSSALNGMSVIKGLNFEDAITFFIHAGLRNGSINSTILGDMDRINDGNQVAIQSLQVPVKYRRVFHLDIYAHSDIAVRILEAMDSEQRNMTGSRPDAIVDHKA